MIITLSEAERQQLDELTHRGTHKARVLTRARILMKGADGKKPQEIADALEVSVATVYNTYQHYHEGGLERVVNDRPSKPHERALDADGEAILIAVACSEVPDGHDHWTLRLLRGKLIELGVVEHISASTVHATLKKTNSSRGAGKAGVYRKWMPPT